MPKNRGTSQCDHRFVVDGCERAWVAIKPEIRIEVEREYSARLETASFLERWRIRREMKAEIGRRIRDQAPLDALY